MIDVYCFSGAGHSAEVAAYCAERLGGRVISIGADTVCRGERVLIVFPVYCENLPPPVAGFLRRAEAGYAALIATYGGMSYGRVLYDAQQLFPGSVIAGAYIPTEHSLACDGWRFDGAPLAPLLAKISEGGAEIMFPKTPKHILSDFAPAWRSRIGAKLVRGGNCVGCNACGAACPMRAMRQGRANSACIRCLRCALACPQGALPVRLSPVLSYYLRRRRCNDTVVYLN